MYCTLEEFLFIAMAVICGLLIWKCSGLILKGIGRLTIKIGARILAKELKEIEIAKAIEKAKKEEEVK